MYGESVPYDKIPVILKRFSFESKMNQIQRYSGKLIEINGIKSLTDMMDVGLPWELETLALFSIMTEEEYDDQNFQSKKGTRMFRRMVNSIREFTPLNMEEMKYNPKQYDLLLISYFLNQFSIQEDMRIKLYRTTYFYNFKNKKVDMNDEFKNFFGVSYQEMKEFSLFVHTLFYLNNNKKLSNEMVKKLLQAAVYYYQDCLLNLTIKKGDGIKFQRSISSKEEQYVFGFKFFYQYPFIEHNTNIFLPLPHLLLQSTTDSLLYRLTEGNKSLRDKFGKEVLENYLLHVFNDIGGYEEVESEIVYKNKSDVRSLDVMIKQQESCLLIDCKSSVPGIDLRNFKIDAYERQKQLIAHNVKKLYEQIKFRFQKEYFPFGREVTFADKDVYGAIVVLSDSYIRREEIFLEVADLLDISRSSKEFEYLCSNIKVLSLYDVERLVFFEKDVFKALRISRDDKNKWFDFGLKGDQSEDYKFTDGVQKMLNEDLEQINRIVYSYLEKEAMK